MEGDNDPQGEYWKVRLLDALGIIAKKLHEVAEFSANKIFNDDLMIALAVILAFVVVLPFQHFLRFSPAMEAIFENLYYPIIAAFIVEYVSKLYIAKSKRLFVTNPWQILNLFIIILALSDFSNLIPTIPYLSNHQIDSPMLRLLRIPRPLFALISATIVTKSYKKNPDITKPLSKLQISTLEIDKQGKKVVRRCYMDESCCPFAREEQPRCFDLQFDNNTEINTDRRGKKIVRKCSMEESCYPIARDGLPRWIDFQLITETDLDRIAELTTISRDDIDKKLIKRSIPRIDHINGISTPTIFLSDIQVNPPNHKVNSTENNDSELNITINNMLIVCINNNIITLSKQKSKLFDEICKLPEFNPFPLKEETLAVRVIYSILHQKMSHYYEIVQLIKNEFEEDNLEKTSPTFLKEAFHLKEEIQKVNSSLWHFHQVLRHIKEQKIETISDVKNKENSSLAKIKNNRYFDDLHEESDFMLKKTIQYIKEDLASLIELHTNNVSYDTNRIMKKIAAVTCLAIIPSVIGGILGVNLSTLSNMGDGFPLYVSDVVFLICFLMVLGIYAFFKMDWW